RAATTPSRVTALARPRAPLSGPARPGVKLPPGPPDRPRARLPPRPPARGRVSRSRTSKARAVRQEAKAPGFRGPSPFSRAAAPQVGLTYQMFVLNLPALKPDAGPDEKPRLEGSVFINPVILERKNGTVEGEEGCLSFPGLFQKVRRAKSVVVQAYNLKGEAV